MMLLAIGLGLGLAIFNSIQTENNLPKIEIVNQGYQGWQFRQVKVGKSASGLIVTGKMDAQWRYDLPSGHVDIAAWSASHQLVVETTTTYNPRFLTFHASRKGGVRFSASLPSLPAGSQIKVAFHQDSPKRSMRPVHDRTVAR